MLVEERAEVFVDGAIGLPAVGAEHRLGRAACRRETETASGGKTITEKTPLDSFPLYKRQAKGAPLVLQ